MQITADPQIPLVAEVFSSFGRVELVPGASIDSGSVADADVLLVRSVTRVDESLLAGSRVRFVGSATIGTDHIDTDYLAGRGIAFASAPGSNAGSVAEYVVAALLAVFADRGDDLLGRVAGVVGLGNIGSRVADRLRALGMIVRWNDPPLLERGSADADYRELPSLLDDADVLLLHTPLTRVGPHPTRHLIGERELQRLDRDALVVNTSRGGVVDDRALLGALAAGRLGGAVLDVWEDEPDPEPALIEACALATPHIAGYSLDGKVRGALMIAEALAAWLGEPPDPAWYEHLRPPPLPVLRTPPAGTGPAAWLDALVRQMYDIRADDAGMRSLASLDPDRRVRHFHLLRSSYPERRSFEWHRTAEDPPRHLRTAVLEGLGVAIQPVVDQRS